MSMIRSVKLEDAQNILNIYNYYVTNTVVTFDLEPLSLEVFKEKINTISQEYPFIVFEEENEILGYAYGSRFRPKPAYNNTVESTVYVKNGEHDKKIGTKLYRELLKRLKEKKYHVVLGVLTLPNEASVRLHENFGFNKVAHLKETGLKFDTWHDVGFWQLTF